MKTSNSFIILVACLVIFAACLFACQGDDDDDNDDDDDQVEYDLTCLNDRVIPEWVSCLEELGSWPIEDHELGIEQARRKFHGYLDYVCEENINPMLDCFCNCYQGDRCLEFLMCISFCEGRCWGWSDNCL